MILKVARMGHPVLRQRAVEVAPRDLQAGRLRQLVADMMETMDEYGGIGLAAPQVHVPLRVVVLDLPASARDPEDAAIPRMAMVNPVLTPEGDDTMQNWEGCLSLPELIGQVRRPRRVRATWLDLDGTPREQVFQDFPAAAVQHEADHLDGVLYLDRVADLKTFMFTREFGRYHARGHEEEVAEEG
jgi:peptide deformylase